MSISQSQSKDQQTTEEFNGKFFVWTKNGRRPRFAHDTHDAALAEARRLAAVNPDKKFIVQQFLEKVFVEPSS